MGEWMTMVIPPFFYEQRAGQDLSRAGLAIVCGCGAIRANLAETLVCMGPSRLRLIDCDRIDASDNSASRQAVQDAIYRLALSCLRIGFSRDGYEEAV